MKTKAHIASKNIGDQSSLQLIDLFQLSAEELTEAGMTYETLKLLQKQCLSLR